MANSIGALARDSGGSVPVSEPRTEQALTNLQEAARRSDASGAARAIVDWGRAQGAYAGLNSLPAVAKWVDDGRVADDLYALDAHLYRGVDERWLQPQGKVCRLLTRHCHRCRAFLCSHFCAYGLADWLAGTGRARHTARLFRAVS